MGMERILEDSESTFLQPITTEKRESTVNILMVRLIINLI